MKIVKKIQPKIIVFTINQDSKVSLISSHAMEFEHKMSFYCLPMFGLKCEHGDFGDPFAKRFIKKKTCLLFSTLIFNSLIIN